MYTERRVEDAPVRVDTPGRVEEERVPTTRRVVSPVALRRTVVPEVPAALRRTVVPEVPTELRRTLWPPFTTLPEERRDVPFVLLLEYEGPVERRCVYTLLLCAQCPPPPQCPPPGYQPPPG